MLTRPATSPPQITRPTSVPVSASGPGDPDLSGATEATTHAGRPRPAPTVTGPASAAPASMPPDITELLPAARAAWNDLHRHGHRLTRDTLAAQLPQNGYPVGNSRLTLILQALRTETAIPPPIRTHTAA